MKQVINDIEEHGQFLSKYRSVSTYNLPPEFYFEQFPQQVIDQIHDESLLPLRAKEKLMDIPAGYFTDFPDRIQDILYSESLYQQGSNAMPYSLPDSYFETFPAAILSICNQQSHFTLQKNYKQFWVKSLSLAASILLLIGIAFQGLVGSDFNQMSNSAAEHQLAGIPDIEIDHYLQQHESEVDYTMALESGDETPIDFPRLEDEVLDKAFDKITEEELINYTF